MIHTQDIDPYAKETENGTALEYLDSNAIHSALYNFVTSSRGDYIYNPGVGGIIDRLLFRSMNKTTLEDIYFILYTNITNYFTPSVRLLSVNVIPDYMNKIAQIVITYQINTGEILSTDVFVKTEADDNRIEYYVVDYVGENLYNFCLAKKSDMWNQFLTYDPDIEYWIWGLYKFINLTTSDEYFDLILKVCNT